VHESQAAYFARIRESARRLSSQRHRVPDIQGAHSALSSQWHLVPEFEDVQAGARRLSRSDT
jgi:hypothetical protein